MRNKPFEYDDTAITFTQTENHENEEALLGAVMRDGKAYERVREIVKPTMFGIHAFGWCWNAIERLHDSGMGIDTITVGDELERMSKMADFSDGGKTGRALLSFLRETGNPRNVEAYAENVQDYFVKKYLEEVGTKMVAWSRNGRRASAIIPDIDRILGEIVLYSGKTDEHAMTAKDAVSVLYDSTVKASRGEIKYTKFGLIDLDEIMGGLMPTNLYVIAARPGQGKTGFLLTVAKDAAQRQKKNVLIFSIEMSNEQLMARLMAMETGIPVERILKGQLTAEEWPVFTGAVEIIEDLSISLNDLPAIRPSQMRQYARRMHAKKRIDLILVDYIQIARADERGERRDIEVGAITNALKALAKELDVPVLAASQLSRKLEERSDKRPVLSDLRESGSIEQDSDAVLFIYRPDQYEPETKKQNVAEIIVAKHRNGRVGTVDTIFRGPVTKFENAVSRYENFGNRKDLE